MYATLTLVSLSEELVFNILNSSNTNKQIILNVLSSSKKLL